MYCIQWTLFCSLEKEPKPPVFTRSSLPAISIPRLVSVPVRTCAAVWGPACSKQLDESAMLFMLFSLQQDHRVKSFVQHHCNVFLVVFWLMSFLVVTACLLQHCRELSPLQRRSKLLFATNQVASALLISAGKMQCCANKNGQHCLKW